MKKIICLTLTLLLLLPLFSLASLTASGEENPTLEELTAVAKDAVYFGEMVKFGYSDLVHMKFDKIYPVDSYIDVVAWAEEKGYLPGEYEGETVLLKNCKGEETEHTLSMWTYADQFTTLEQMKKELKQYFLYDFCELISCGGHTEDDLIQTCVNPHIQEYQGRVYGNAELVDLSYLPIWETARLGATDADRAELIVSVEDHSQEETILLTKTSEGWRVSGGSYFEMRYGISIPENPPKTGEHTGLYALIFTLAVLPLGVFTIGAFKKRRRGAV